MRDPYQVLGVPRTADEKAIKSAFRKLAKQYHPDQNKNNPKAKERFSEANAAYEILGDKEKRQLFDSGAIDAEGKERFQGFEGFGGGRGRSTRGGFAGAQGGFSGAEDILSQMFGGLGGQAGPAGMAGMGGDPFAQAGARQGPFGQGRAPKGADKKITLSVHLKDLVAGKAPVRLSADRTVNVTIPPEPEDGQIIRLKGQGEEGPAGAGDALVTLKLSPHRDFQREGANLRVHVPVALETAVLGGKIRVPTLTGAVALTIPAWSTSGAVFRVRGKGLPSRANGHGDILAVLSIQLPDGPDDALAKLMKQRSPD